MFIRSKQKLKSDTAPLNVHRQSASTMMRHKEIAPCRVPVKELNVRFIGADDLLCWQLSQIPWQDLSEAGPAFITIIVMPTTNNIAYGCIAGIIAWILVKFVTYGLFSQQQKWWGYNRFQKWTEVSILQSRLSPFFT